MFLLCLIAASAHAEHPYDYINDYTSNDDRSCRGWRLWADTDNKLELLQLTHYGTRRTDHRAVLVAPSLGWWYEEKSLPYTFPKWKSVQNLMDLLQSSNTPIVSRHANGHMGLANSRGWLGSVNYDEIFYTAVTPKYRIFKRADSVGLLEMDGREAVTLKGSNLELLDDQHAVVTTSQGQGLWSIPLRNWLLIPAKQNFHLLNGLFIAERDGLKTYLNPYHKPATPFIYLQLVPLSGDRYVLAFGHDQYKILDRNGKIAFEPKGTPIEPAKAPIMERKSEKHTNDYSSATLPLDLNKVRAGYLNLPSLKVFKDLLFVWRQTKWDVYSIENGLQIGVFDQLMLPSYLTAESVIWVKQGHKNGFFKIGEGWVSTANTAPPSDFEFPFWSLYATNNGWDVAVPADANKSILHFATQTFDPVSMLAMTRTGELSQLILVRADGQRWTPCGRKQEWKEESSCLPEPPTDYIDDEMSLKKAGLFYVNNLGATNKGRVQIGFPSGRKTALHKSCRLLSTSTLLSCQDDTPPDVLLRYTSDSSKQVFREGRRLTFTLYRAVDGLNIRPRGQMKQYPLLYGKNGPIEVKTTETLQWWDHAMQKKIYQLDCSTGSPILYREDGSVIWRYHPGLHGFHGRVNPAFRQFFNEIHDQAY